MHQNSIFQKGNILAPKNIFSECTLMLNYNFQDPVFSTAIFCLFYWNCDQKSKKKITSSSKKSFVLKNSVEKRNHEQIKLCLLCVHHVISTGRRILKLVWNIEWIFLLLILSAAEFCILRSFQAISNLYLFWVKAPFINEL